jgi:amidase
LRIGVMRRAAGNGFALHADCLAAVDDAAQLLAALGHAVEESHPQALDDPDVPQPLGRVISSWTARDLDDWSRKTQRQITGEDVEAFTWGLAEMGRGVSAPQYIEAVAWLQAYTRRIASWWANGFDVLLTPTLGEPPPKLGDLVPSADDPMRPFFRSVPFVTFTAPFNVTGQPATSLPLYWSADGLPIGVQLVAAYSREDLLLRVASQLEQARPWSDRRAVHA